jgi:hypothetical protein
LFFPAPIVTLFDPIIAVGDDSTKEDAIVDGVDDDKIAEINNNTRAEGRRRRPC